MYSLRLLLTAILAPCLPLAHAAEKTVPVQFPGGQKAVTLQGVIQGEDGVLYLLSSGAGARWNITLQATGSTNFNITAPGSDTALFIGSTTGRKFEGALPTAGEYKVQVYQMRNDARRGKVSNFSIVFRPLSGFVAAAGEAAPPAFNAKGDTRCGASAAALNQQCGFKVARKAGGSAEIWLDRPGAKGSPRVLHFQKGEFTSKDNAKVTTRKDQDTWYVTVDGKEVYMIPDAMILGG
jgi:hypothetical protein